MELEEELSALITDLLNFKLKREQEIAVESLFMNQDVLIVLPTAYGKNSVNITNADYKCETKEHHQRLDCQSKPSVCPC